MAAQPSTILYITGPGRCGGTLLGRLLDQFDGVCYVGELRQMWRPGLAQRICACGAAVGDCPFWQAVFARAWGESGAPDLAWADALRLRFTRTRHALRALPPPGRAPDLDRFVALLGRLYGAIAEVSGCRVIVDSSRMTAYARLLARALPEARVIPLHLVRDPRAVVFSWQRRASRAGAPMAVALRPKHALRAALEWNVQNALAEAWRRRDGGALVRYEDLIAEPVRALRSALAPAGLSAEADFIEGDVARLQPGHSLEGNVYRLARGDVPLRLDDAWQTGLSPGLRRQVTLLCWPLMQRYRYA